ncbi:four helix bundle protein [Hufsiella ginkgonis]|uniref:Four helix bundle protein n=1 Tax=Hufsiella ginkgonis TaxID=2695274 RepID=A0A7K1XSZ6_9SPHI|nr:four helix bundle protein [Hufsiella ginkgonis]MXV14040.1 four helix bundle protein [Hufsiella ginkgonis]
MKPHQEMEVWKRSFGFVKVIYVETAKFPKSELYGLTSQMRRASASIPVNIAEGCARKSDKELLQFLHISLGSASELDALVLLSAELGLITKERCGIIIHDLDFIYKLLIGFINSVKKRINNAKETDNRK